MTFQYSDAKGKRFFYDQMPMSMKYIAENGEVIGESTNWGDIEA